MRCRCVWCICCSAAVVVAQACSSDDTTSPSVGNDSGIGIDATAVGDAASPSDGAPKVDADASAPMTCDASVVTTMNACTQCATMNCSMQLAMCSADCACAQAETCALTLSSVFILSKCPNAVNAGFNNQPFMNINGCLAQYCLNPCSHTDAGTSEGGSGDSGAPDGGATDAGGADASGE
jgi:hypothetical protein